MSVIQDMRLDDPDKGRGYSQKFALTAFLKVCLSCRSWICLPYRILHDRSLQVRPLEVRSAEIRPGKVGVAPVSP